MTDALSSGRRFRTLNIVDDYTRECLAIEVDTWLGGVRVVRVLEELKQRRGTRQIRYASGSEFYGDYGHQLLDENYGPLLPVSTYGASKLAGESIICAYCHMFG